MKTLPIIFIAALMTLAGCATKPNADEICTAAWIKPRVDLALGDFRNNADDILKTLKNTSKEVADSGGQLGLIQRAGVLLSLGKLVNTFQNGQTLKDINTLSKTCNDPDLATRVFTDVLKEYNVPDSFVTLLDELKVFKNMAEQAATTMQ